MSIIRTLWYRLRKQPHSTIRIGPAAGLRFDPGPSNPRYGVGDNELPVQEALRRHLQEGDVFYDVGANVGFLTVVGATLVGETGLVYAFEPVPANARFIRRNVEANALSNVKVEPIAVGDRCGTATLALAEYSGGAALAEVETPPDLAGHIDVDISTIDRLVQLGFRPPSLVKIDVEGAELQVLMGMSDVCTHVRPTIVYELDGPTEEALATKHENCQRWLSEQGYVVSELPRSYVLDDWCVRHFVASHPEYRAAS